ncbi:MAG: HesA/MoeB/ThiF family protein [Rhodothermales bacterium]
MDLLHETRYRTASAMARLGEARVAVCGAGALGGNLAESLARSGIRRLTLIDHDRVEPHNLPTQPYTLDDIGASKADVLADALYRAVEADITPHTVTLDATNADALLRGHDLIIDGFDNHAARKAVAEWGIQTSADVLHTGLADGFAEVVWNEIYRVPSARQEDVCDYPLTRTLALLAANLACEVALRFLISDVRESFTLTLADLRICPFA